MNSTNGTKRNNEDESNSRVQIRNKYLRNLDKDTLYHLGMDTKTDNLKALFGDVKFVCMGGTPRRMEAFAKYIQKELGYPETKLTDMCASANRFAMYKVGPVLSVSHGMGMPSISILLHEVIKLMYYAECKNPIFFRIGTSGGVGVEPGTVIVTEEALNGFAENVHEFVILGRREPRPAILDEKLANDLVVCAEREDDFEIMLGKTMSTDDFYEGQGRTDGAVCEHSEEDKLKYLHKLYSKGVRNIEMEATMFAALTNYTGIKAADVCVAFINRFDGDQVPILKQTKTEFENRPQLVVGRYIKKCLSETNNSIH